MEGYLVTPERLEFDQSLVKKLQLPKGFQINVFGKDLGNPRKSAIAPDGTVYVTRREQGDVIALIDRNRDGRADEQRTVASISNTLTALLFIKIVFTWSQIGNFTQLIWEGVEK